MAKKGENLSGRIFWAYWFPLIVYGLAIFIQSAYPSPDIVPDILNGDKVLHFFGYAIMGGLFFRALQKTNSHWKPATIIFFSILFTALYGAGDEIHQIFVVSRTADIWDALADLLGGSFGTACFFMAVRHFGRRAANPPD